MPLLPIMKVHSVSGILTIEDLEKEHDPLYKAHMWMIDNLDESDWFMFGPAAHVAYMHQDQKTSIDYRIKQLLLWFTGQPSIHTHNTSYFLYHHSLQDINRAHRSYHDNPKVYSIKVPHEHPFT